MICDPAGIDQCVGLSVADVGSFLSAERSATEAPPRRMDSPTAFGASTVEDDEVSTAVAHVQGMLEVRTAATAEFRHVIVGLGNLTAPSAPERHRAHLGGSVVTARLTRVHSHDFSVGLEDLVQRKAAYFEALRRRTGPEDQPPADPVVCRLKGDIGPQSRHGLREFAERVGDELVLVRGDVAVQRLPVRDAHAAMLMGSARIVDPQFRLNGTRG